MSPRVSVIIPAFNQSRLLRELLESVLAQEGCEVEVLVIDDCSADDTVEVASALSSRVRVMTTEHNQGPAINRLRGYEATSGEFVVFADQDDVYTDSGWFAHACDVLDGEPGLAFVSGQAEVLTVLSGDSYLSELPPVDRMDGTDYLEGFQTSLPKPTSTFTSVFRRSSLDAAGLVKTSGVGDSALYLRALLAGGAAFVHRPIGVYRLHSASMTVVGPPPHTIVHTLEEKKAIYESLDARGWGMAPRWLADQCMVTVGYMVGVSPLRKMMPWPVARWILSLPAPARRMVIVETALCVVRRTRTSVPRFRAPRVSSSTAGQGQRTSKTR